MNETSFIHRILNIQESLSFSFLSLPQEKRKKSD